QHCHDYHSPSIIMIPRPPRSTPFPTRRSSDLTVGQNIISGAVTASITVSPVANTVYWVRIIDAAPCYRASVGGPTKEISITSTRSEEHTSELQSRENLVCRLLLEKKNKTIWPY